MLSAEISLAARNTLRVYDDTAQQMNENQVNECLSFIQNAKLTGDNRRNFVLAVQAVVFSKGARKASEAILFRFLRPGSYSKDIPSYELLGKSLDVALFDTYRQADPLKFDGAEEMIRSVQIALDAMLASPPKTSISVRTSHFDQITRLMMNVMVHLLNTEHQADAAHAINTYLHIAMAQELTGVPDGMLHNILRKSYIPPRTVFTPQALMVLRATAVEAARKRFSINPSISSFSDTAARLSAFRFLLFSDLIDEQAAVLQSFAKDAVRYPSEETLNNLINSITWAHETTQDQEITLLCEKLFLEDSKMSASHSHLAMATRFGDRQHGEDWLTQMASRPATINSRFLEAKFWLAMGEPEKAVDAASKALSVQTRIPQERRGLASSVENWRIYNSRPTKYIRRILGKTPTNAILASVPDASILYGLVRTAQEARFLGDLHQFSKESRAGVSRLDNNVSIVVVSNHLNFLSQMPVAAIERARNEGAEIVSLVRGMYPSSENLTPASALLNEALIPPFYFKVSQPSHAVSSAWHIAPENQEFIYKGVNYHFGVHNSLGIIFRRFNLDYTNPLVLAQLRRHLVIFQNIHDMFDLFTEKMDPKREYRFLAVGVQFGVGYAIRSVVSNAKLPNVRIIHAANGFEAFDSSWRIDEESDNPVASFHSVADLTDTPNTPLGFRPRPEDCRTTIFNDVLKYFSVNPVVEAYFNKIDRRAAEALARHQDAPRKERRVLMLGTILPDLSIPQDRGFVHRDIADWVTATLGIAEEENFTLVVKQHPSELNHKIGFYVAEKFVDLFPRDTKNVEILPYEMGFHDAVLDADLVILWSGTSTIELAAMGLPYLACSRYAQEEYPLFAQEFSTQEEYRAILAGREEVQAHPHARLHAVDLVHRITTSPCREPSLWPKRQLLNAQTWPARIDPSLARDLVSDEHALRLAERIIRGESGMAFPVLRQHGQPERHTETIAFR